MKIQLRDDLGAIRLDLEGVEMMDIAQATQLASDLIDAVQQCGGTVNMNVEVKRNQPTPQQLAAAVARVGMLRKTFDSQPWNDQRANMELVQRVLECL